MKILDTDSDNFFRVCNKVPESDARSVGHTDNDNLFLEYGAGCRKAMLGVWVTLIMIIFF